MATEETTPESDAAASDAPATEARPLNRAERRAQQNKKKGAATISPSGVQHGGPNSGAAARTGGAGQVRLPRTGHK